MNQEELKELKEKLSNMTQQESDQRDIYLKQLADGTLQGPPVGYPEIDKPWLGLYSEKDVKSSAPRMTIYNFLKKCNEGNEENILLEYMGKKIKTKEVFEKANFVAERLVNDYNIKKGDVVSICLPTMPETYYLFLALNKIGAIANLIDPRINEERISECIGDNSKLVFSIDAYNEKISKATHSKNIDVVSISGAQSLNKVMKMVYKHKAKIKDIKEFISWDTFMSSKKNDILAETMEYEENQVAAIVYTSGTTGVPKGVMLTNDNINYIAYSQQKNVPDMEAGDKYLVIMPPFIAYGLVCGICCPMSTCQKMILVPKFNPKEFDKLFMKHKPNHMLGVPSFFEDLIKSKLVKNENLSFVKYCIVGGDKMSSATEERINEFFKNHKVKNKIVKGYGMTELSSAAFTNRDNNNNKLGSVGTPYIKNNVMIVSPETKETLGYNTTGEVYISSPSIMNGYVNKPDEEKNVIYVDEYNKKWVKTGDLGSIDTEGNLTINGRLKRMIVRPDGHNVFPSVIEDLLSSHQAVDNVVVVGIESYEYENGKIPTAFIVLKDEYIGKEQEILQQLIKLSEIKLPPRDVALNYNFINELPLTPVGKVDIKQLEEAYAIRDKEKSR